MKPIKSYLISFFVFAFALSTLGCQSQTQSMTDPQGKITSSNISQFFETSAPRQALNLYFPGGPALVPFEKQGLATLITEVLSEGRVGESKSDLERFLFLKSGSIAFQAQKNYFLVVIKAPPETFADVVQKTYEILKNPKFDEKTFKAVRDRTLSQKLASMEALRNVVVSYAYEDLFADNPNYYRSSSMPKRLKGFTLQDVTNYYGKLVNLNKTFAVSWGPVPEKTLEQQIPEELRKGIVKFDPTTLPDKKNLKYLGEKPQVTILHKDNVSNNEVFFAFPQHNPYDTKEYISTQIAQQLIGGGTFGILKEILRKDRGLTYHAGSNIANDQYWYVYTFGGVKETLPLIQGVQELLAEIKKIKPFKEDQVEAVKTKLLSQHKERSELLEDIFLVKQKRILKKRNPLFFDQYPGVLKSITAADVNAILDRFVNDKEFYLYLAGDKNNLLANVKKAGFEKVKVVDVAEL